MKMRLYLDNQKFHRKSDVCGCVESESDRLKSCFSASIPEKGPHRELSPSCQHIDHQLLPDTPYLGVGE